MRSRWLVSELGNPYDVQFSPGAKVKGREWLSSE